MQRAWLFGVLGAIVLACGETTVAPLDDDDDAGDAGRDGSLRPETGADGSLPPVDSSVPDTGSDAGGESDASLDASDASSDASDASDGGVPSDAAVDADPDGGPVNVAALGTATASSIYSPSYPASNAIDGDVQTSWYSESSSCTEVDGGPTYVCSAPPTHITIALDAIRTISRVKIFGNRDYETLYDVLTARLELLDASGNVVYTTDLTTSRGPEPNGDVDHLVAPPRAGVKTLRVTVLTADGDGPGLSEIEAY